MVKIILEYDPNYKAVPDGKVEEEFEKILLHQLTGELFLGIYGNENIFSRIRLGIAEGQLSHENVFFEFKGERYTLDKYGKMNIWPDGFCDYCINTSEKILRAAIKKYEEN